MSDRWWCGLLLAVSAVAQAPEVHYLQLPDGFGGCVRDVVLRDLNRDGRPDLIISTGACSHLDDDAALPARTLRIHLRRDGRPGYAARPDRELRLARNVVAFAVGDVHPNPGAEIVLFAPSVAAAAFWPVDSEEPSYARLAGIRLLWQPAMARVAFAWQRAVVDLDGDGRDDLLIPEPGGYRVLRQAEGAKARFGSGVVLRVPSRPPAAAATDPVRFESRARRVAAELGGDLTTAHTLVDVVDAVPAPHVIDQDGDGDLDVCALVGETIAVWRQEASGRYSATPSATYDLPSRRRSFVNPSYSVQLCHLDGDRRADLVMVSSQTIDDEVRSTVEVYLGADEDGPLGGGTRASDALRLAGFVGVPAFDDVDGDGRPDLAIGSLRTDVIGSLAGAASSEGRVRARLSLFRNDFDSGEGRFARPVSLAHEVEVVGIGVEQRADVLARFWRDVDGDGLADLLLRSEPEVLRILRCRARGRRLTVGDSLWDLRIAKRAAVQTVAVGGIAALLVREERQVVLAEFR